MNKEKKEKEKGAVLPIVSERRPVSSDAQLFPQLFLPASTTRAPPSKLTEQRLACIQTLSWARTLRFERLPGGLFGRYAALLPAYCSSERRATNT